MHAPDENASPEMDGNACGSWLRCMPSACSGGDSTGGGACACIVAECDGEALDADHDSRL